MKDVRGVVVAAGGVEGAEVVGGGTECGGFVEVFRGFVDFVELV